MIIDLPPGTGDIPLSVMQSIPVEGLITVSSPQDVAALVVRKSVNMAQMMEKPVIGLVENMSYISCPGCGEVIHLREAGRRRVRCRNGNSVHRRDAHRPFTFRSGRPGARSRNTRVPSCRSSPTLSSSTQRQALQRNSPVLE